MTRKSPIRYPGNKLKLMPEILKHLPTGTVRAVDAFGGSAVVVLNLPMRYRLYNELSLNIFNYVDALSSLPPKEVLKRIQVLMKKYKLSGSNAEGFLALRNKANETRDPIMFYTLSRYAFSSMSRFGKDGTFNNAFARGRTSLNLHDLRAELDVFYRGMSGVRKTNFSYTELLGKLRDRSLLNSKTFIYFDPPYLATGRMQFYGDCWSPEADLRLMRNLDHLTKLKVPWMMSNALSLKGIDNKPLRSWASKYRVVRLRANYILSRGKPKVSEEVLILNYF